MGSVMGVVSVVLFRVCIYDTRPNTKTYIVS